MRIALKKYDRGDGREVTQAQGAKQRIRRLLEG